MTMVTLKGEFEINGQRAQDMSVDAAKSIRFNDASGIVAVVATGEDGKVVKGLTMADDQVLLQLVTARATKDATIRVPEAFR